MKQLRSKIRKPLLTLEEFNIFKKEANRFVKKGKHLLSLTGSRSETSFAISALFESHCYNSDGDGFTLFKGDRSISLDGFDLLVRDGSGDIMDICYGDEKDPLAWYKQVPKIKTYAGLVAEIHAFVAGYCGWKD